MYSISQLSPGPNRSTCRQSDIAVRERQRVVYCYKQDTLLVFLAAFSGDYRHNRPYHPATMSSNLPLRHTTRQNGSNSIANSIFLIGKMSRRCEHLEGGTRFVQGSMDPMRLGRYSESFCPGSRYDPFNTNETEEALIRCEDRSRERRHCWLLLFLAFGLFRRTFWN